MNFKKFSFCITNQKRYLLTMSATCVCALGLCLSLTLGRVRRGSWPPSPLSSYMSVKKGSSSSSLMEKHNERSTISHHEKKENLCSVSLLTQSLPGHHSRLHVSRPWPLTRAACSCTSQGYAAPDWLRCSCWASVEAPQRDVTLWYWSDKRQNKHCNKQWCSQQWKCINHLAQIPRLRCDCSVQ